MALRIIELKKCYKNVIVEGKLVKEFMGTITFDADEVTEAMMRKPDSGYFKYKAILKNELGIDLERS